MIQHQQFIGVPFVIEQNPRKAIRNVLVNAVGFGGNAVSVLLSRPCDKNHSYFFNH
jgi:3-oxoacyl-(acyl-carrier-protein) synthase